MPKKYVVLLSLVLLGVIFTSFMLLTENRYNQEVNTLVDYKTKENLIFFSSWAGYDSKADAIGEILAEFQEEHGAIDVVNKSTGGNDFLFTLKADFVSGKTPDVFGLWPGSDIELLIDEGKVQPLDSFISSDDEWYSTIGNHGWDLVTYENKVYGIPYEIIYEGLFINQDIFGKYNLSEPENYEQLKACIVTLRENGITPIAFNATPEGSFLYQNIVMSLGGKLDVEEPFDEQGKIKQCFIDAMYIMKELYELGAFPEDYISLSDNDRNRMFIEKDAAMIVQGSWFIGDGAINPDADDIRIVPIPLFENSKARKGAIIYGLGNGVLHISKQAWEDEGKRPYCIELVKKITSAESAAKLVNNNAAHINVNIPEYMIDAPNMYYVGRTLMNDATEWIEPVDSHINRSLWESVIVENFPHVLEGELTPEEVFEQVEAKQAEKE